MRAPALILMLLLWASPAWVSPAWACAPEEADGLIADAEEAVWYMAEPGSEAEALANSYLDQAVAAYNDGNFVLACDLANAALDIVLF